MTIIDKNQSDAKPASVRPSLAADERANRYDVLSRLADDLAHEIKNPLNAIVVNLEVLRRRVVKGASDGALERADVIEDEIRRVHALVDQLLQLLRPSKPQTGPVAVDGIVDALAAAVKLQAKAARVEFDYKTESSLYAQLSAEAFKFALLNVLTHAIDAEAAAGGSISMVAGRGSDGIYVKINCTHASLADSDEPLVRCAALMRHAGGALQSVEPQSSGHGSTVALVLTPAQFGEMKPTGNGSE